MKLRTIQIFQTAFLCILLCSTVGCEKQPIAEEELSTPLPTLEILNPETGECEQKGAKYKFSLQVSGPGYAAPIGLPTGMTYLAYHGPTASFSLARHCLCSLKEYRIEFDYLPVHTDILVKKLNGHSIPFAGPFPNNGYSGQHITISQSFLATSIAIGFVHSVSPIPQLRDAGGFCIVDNISGPRITLERTTIYHEPAYSTFTDGWYDNYFLPLSEMDYLIP